MVFAAERGMVTPDGTRGTVNDGQIVLRFEPPAVFDPIRSAYKVCTHASPNIYDETQSSSRQPNPCKVCTPTITAVNSAASSSSTAACPFFAG